MIGRLAEPLLHSPAREKHSPRTDLGYRPRVRDARRSHMRFCGVTEVVARIRCTEKCREEHFCV